MAKPRYKKIHKERLADGAYRITYEAIQCRSNSNHLFGRLRCQGFAGHDGPHWCYDEKGWLECWKNQRLDDPQWRAIGHVTTPPGHKTYIHPNDQDYYGYFTKQEIK